MPAVVVGLLRTVAYAIIPYTDIMTVVFAAVNRKTRKNKRIRKMQPKRMEAQRIMTSRQVDNYNDVLPTRLRAIIDNKKIALVELAEKTGITRQRLGNYKDGKNVPDANALKKLAEALEVSADYLLGLSDSKNTANAFSTCADVIEILNELEHEFKGITIDLNEGKSELVEYDDYEEIEWVIKPSVIVRISTQGIIDYFSQKKKFDVASHSVAMLNDIKKTVYDSLLADARKSLLTRKSEDKTSCNTEPEELPF